METTIATLYFYLEDLSWSYEGNRRDKRLHISASYKHPDLVERSSFEVQVFPRSPSSTSRFFKASIEHIDEIEGPEGDVLVRNLFQTLIRVNRQEFAELLALLKFATDSVRAKAKVNLAVEGFVVNREGTQSPEFYAQISNGSPLKVRAFGFELMGQC